MIKRYTNRRILYYTLPVYSGAGCQTDRDNQPAFRAMTLLAGHVKGSQPVETLLRSSWKVLLCLK